MIAELECLPCLVRQAKEMALMTTGDVRLQKRIMRNVLSFMSGADLDRSPPEIMQGVGEVVTSVTGVSDPYREIKAVHTRAALDMLPRMDEIILEAPDPFIAGLKLAIAGNIIDLGAKQRVSGDEITNTLHEALHFPVRGMEPMELKSRIHAAERVLYLTDNAGETVFDRKFLEHFPAGRTVVAVRGGPALNDATMEDARAAGLHTVAELVSNGSAAPATVLSDCSREFRELAHAADVIVAKGQGNYESLSSSDLPVHFLFRVKCELVAGHCGFPMGSLVLLDTGAVHG